MALDYAGVGRFDVDIGMPPKRVDKRVVRVFASHEEAEKADMAYWRSLTPQQRLDAVGECVREYLRLRHEPEQRLLRVCRVLDQTWS